MFGIKDSVFELDKGKSIVAQYHGHDGVEVMLLSGYSFQNTALFQKNNHAFGLMLNHF